MCRLPSPQLQASPLSGTVTATITAGENTDTGDDEKALPVLAEGEWDITASDSVITTQILSLIIDTTVPTVTVTQSGNTASAAATDTNGVSTSAHYLKTTSTTCDSTLSWNSAAAYTLGQNIQLAEADNTKYICVRAADTAGNYGYGVSSQITGVTDFSIIVGDDSSDFEREKEITVRLTATTDVTNTNWGLVASAAACDSTATTLSNTYTASTTDQTITLSSEENNGQFVCFKATRGRH